MRVYTKKLTMLFGVAIIAAASSATAGTVAGSKHDFSVLGLEWW